MPAHVVIKERAYAQNRKALSLEIPGCRIIRLWFLAIAGKNTYQPEATWHLRLKSRLLPVGRSLE
jgi:hypothetical protein